MLFAALLAVASCSRTDDARLAVAERQMAEHPDSALLTLRKIDATSLNRHNTALYALLLTQAQYKNDITATSDSLINIALDYFSDGKRHIECLIYKGAVLQELGDSRNLVGINFRHPNVMPNFAVWKTITYRLWHRWCCQPRF